VGHSPRKITIRGKKDKKARGYGQASLDEDKPTGLVIGGKRKE